MSESQISNHNSKMDKYTYKGLTLNEKLGWHLETWKFGAFKFERMCDEIDIEQEVQHLLAELEKKNAIGDIEKLYTATQHQKVQHSEVSPYFSQSIISLYLAEEHNKRSEKNRKVLEYHLKYFAENPTKRTEVYFDVLEKLICFDQTTLAVDLCKKTYDAIAKLDVFFVNPKDAVADIIFFDELQKIYLKLKNHLDPEWIFFEKKMQLIDIDFTSDMRIAIENTMQGQVDLKLMEGSFQANPHAALSAIQVLFCCYMHDLDGSSFVTSKSIVECIYNFLFSIDERENVDLQMLFNFKESHLKSFILSSHSQALFDQTHNVFKLLAGLPLLNQFLLHKKILSKQIVEEALKACSSLINKSKKDHSKRPWMYSFISKMETQAKLG